MARKHDVLIHDDCEELRKLLAPLLLANHPREWIEVESILTRLKSNSRRQHNALEAARANPGRSQP